MHKEYYRKDFYLEERKFGMRIGIGYDVHKLVEGRKLIVGGVEIEHETGLLGHSDADVLVHAIMDAMLGAASMGDIGLHFPDTNEKYKNANSLRLLAEVSKFVHDIGYSIGNIDANVIAQRPAFRPYIQKMREKIAEAAGTDISRVNIKATTEERLGFTGREEGISAQAVCLLEDA